MSALEGLSRRERQIMEILFQRGRASASEVRETMDDAPSYSAVRAMLRVLEEKVRELTEKLAANPGSASDARPLVVTQKAPASEAARSVATEIMDTKEWKEHVDGRFRSMFKHLEGDVIPKAVLKVLLTHESKRLTKPAE